MAKKQKKQDSVVDESVLGNVEPTDAADMATEEIVASEENDVVSDAGELCEDIAQIEEMPLVEEETAADDADVVSADEGMGQIEEVFSAEQTDEAEPSEGAVVEAVVPTAVIIEEIPAVPDTPLDEEEPEAIPSEVEAETGYVEEMPNAPGFQTPAELKAAIEVLLFTTPYPLGIQKLCNVLGKIDRKTLRGSISQLQMEYDARNGGLQIMETPEGFRMCTRPAYADVVLRMHQQRKRNPLSMTALETLAIIAYKQPLTRAEVEMIRGVESSGVVRNLMDMDLVKVVGRKEIIGRPQLYGTTVKFLNMFGLNSTAELPSIQSLRRDFSGNAANVLDQMAAAAAGEETKEDVEEIVLDATGDTAGEQVSEQTTDVLPEEPLNTEASEEPAAPVASEEPVVEAHQAALVDITDTSNGNVASDNVAEADGENAAVVIPIVEESVVVAEDDSELIPIEPDEPFGRDPEQV